MSETTHYTVLARRFRPQTFDEVIGQQPVARALQNAIASGRVAHAYLFTGARGVGKTSMARILAKTLNCPNAENGRPCNECDVCRAVAAGHDVDVLEIDGASHTGVDNVRDLRANVNLKPMRSPNKIYIIDEVHMLSKSAFNALLKTLEEPPPNVIFIFCTTEPEKVPDTVLSRCQRFDFATIETQRITERLAEIAQAEGYEVDPAALELVARRAAGSMRDSQSLFDQLLAFGQERITPADVHRLLGTAGDDRLIALAEALVSRQRDEALRQFDQALAEGVQLGELVDQVLRYVRDLMVIAAGAESVSLSSVSQDCRATLAEQARRWGLATIVAAMQILSEAQSRMFRAASARAIAELALVRIALLEELDELSRLIRDLNDGGGQNADRPVRSPAAGPPRIAAGNAGAHPNSPRTGKLFDNGSNGGGVRERSESATISDPVDVPRVEFRSETQDAFWAQLVESSEDRLKRHLRVASRIAISGPNHLEVTFPASYHFSKQYCERPEELTRIGRLAETIAGRPIRLLLHLEEEPRPAADATKPAANTGRPPSGPIDDPFVQQALGVFGGTVFRVDQTTAVREHSEH
ncbi:MAG: DNA polymerase III subunit gamma/tau [Planctomycetaceae bacterium]